MVLLLAIFVVATFSATEFRGQRRFISVARFAGRQKARVGGIDKAQFSRAKL